MMLIFFSEGIIMVLGDVIAQIYLEQIPPRQLDIHRSARFGLIGMTFVAPTVRIWYLSMEKMLGSSVTLANTFRKVGIDQLAFAPLLTAGIVAYIGKLQGQSTSDIKVKLKQELKRIVITGWKIWPTVQIVNFYFVPFLVRPLVVGAIALIWNTYLAWKTRPMPIPTLETALH